MSKQKNQQTPIQSGLAPTEDDEFYAVWARETLKNNITLVNDVLRQFVTINISLLGGSIIFLNNTLIDNIFKAIATLFFMFSLIFSFAGIIPFTYKVDLRVPQDIRENKKRTLKWKQYFLWTSGILIILGLTIALIGVLVHKS